MGKVSRYHENGFYLISQLEGSGLKHQPADTDAIVKGDACHDDGNGYATNTITAFAVTFMGIAASSVDNSAGTAGAVDVEIIPPFQQYQFIVPVANDTTIAQTNVGTIVDLEANDDVDISDVTIAAGMGFFIDDFDASTEAVAVNTSGYAIGHFRQTD